MRESHLSVISSICFPWYGALMSSMTLWEVSDTMGDDNGFFFCLIINAQQEDLIRSCMTIKAGMH